MKFFQGGKTTIPWTEDAAKTSRHLLVTSEMGSSVLCPDVKERTHRVRWSSPMVRVEFQICDNVYESFLWDLRVIASFAATVSIITSCLTGHIRACPRVEGLWFYCPIPCTNISSASEGGLAPSITSKGSTTHMRGARVTQEVSVMSKIR